MDKMNAVAVITARGGSKRIPGKNKKEFLGKPIMVYSIEAALKSGLFSEVMVSTDDEEIAEIARKNGAMVPFMRSEKTANDYATTLDVLNEVVSEYEKLNKHFDYLCCIYPTAPFITPKALSEAMQTLCDKKADAVIPVVKFSFPPQRCMIVDNDVLKAKWPEYTQMRSQDLEPYYHDCGQFYCLNVEAFKTQKKIMMDKVLPFYQDEINVQDIDTMEDWAIAEMKYKILHSKDE